MGKAGVARAVDSRAASFQEERKPDTSSDRPHGSRCPCCRIPDSGCRFSFPSSDSGLLETHMQKQLHPPTDKLPLPFPYRPSGRSFHHFCCTLHRPDIRRYSCLAGTGFSLHYRLRLFSSNRKLRIPMVTIPISFLRTLMLSRTTMIFLKESPMALSGRSSCICFSGAVIAKADWI